MKAQKEDYRRYLQSPGWQATRELRLKAANHQCEFRPEIGLNRSGLIGGCFV